MKKKIIIAVVIMAIVGGIAAYFMSSGQYESTLVKSEIETTEMSEGEPWVNTLKDLTGAYHVSSGEESNAEILFHVEGLKKTIGAFETFEIDLNLEEELSTSSLTVTIQSNSVNTGNSMRDESLADPDFFHVEKYPTMTYVADAIVTSDTGYVAKGNLTLLGKTSPLDVPFKHLGNGTNAKNEAFEAFEGKVIFDRIAYGMEEVGGTGNVVTLSFYAEMIQQ
jgi:polyisoprenoid-binding protein YceI